MKTSLAIIVLSVLALIAVASGASGQNDQEPLATASSRQANDLRDQSEVDHNALASFSVADVAIKAADVNRILNSVMHQQVMSSNLDVISQNLPVVSDQIDRKLEETRLVFGNNPPLPVLQGQQHRWEITKARLVEWLETLTNRAEVIEENLVHVRGLEKTWTTSRLEAYNFNAPELILLTIEEIVTKISKLTLILNDELTTVIALQSQVGIEITRCEGALLKITDIQRTAVSGIFTPDSIPVWSLKAWTSEYNFSENLHSAITSYRGNIESYVTTPSKYMRVLVAIFVLLSVLFLMAQRQLRKWERSGEDFSPFIQVFKFPIAAALSVSLLIITSPYRSPLPASLRDTFQILALVPMIILIRPSVPGRFWPVLYGLACLFVIDVIRDVLFFQQIWSQTFLIVEAVIGLAITGWLLHNLRVSLEEEKGLAWFRSLKNLAVFFFLILGLGCAAAAAGHLRLAQLIIPGIVATCVMAMAMYASVRVLMGFVALSFRVWPLSILNMVRHHQDLLEKRIYQVLLVGAAIGLIVRYLGYIGLLDPVLLLGTAVFNTTLEIGIVKITAADVLYFFITVCGAYLLSTLIRFVLNEDIYPRIPITKGKSFAVSSLFHYLILAVGFTAAISLLGVDLTKLTVLTGALGIGIGFGLQGVVNNFVSGLLLLFERPIEVGDTIEIGELQAKVRKIGIRASTVRTRRGADIIIPNSQLITEKVTNWTFGDQMKRIDLPVGISYASSPHAVTELLLHVALQHPRILHQPEPQGLCIGYGESSINFELRAWTEHIDDWPRIRSELATAIFDAVRAAGMTFPFPQREVRLLKESEGGNA